MVLHKCLTIDTCIPPHLRSKLDAKIYTLDLAVNDRVYASNYCQALCRTIGPLF